MRCKPQTPHIACTQGTGGGEPLLPRSPPIRHQRPNPTQPAPFPSRSPLPDPPPPPPPRCATAPVVPTASRGCRPTSCGKTPEVLESTGKADRRERICPRAALRPAPPPRARGPPCSATEIHSILDCGPQAGTAMAEGSKSPAPGGSLARTEPRHDCLSFAALPVAARHSTPPKVCGMPPPEE